MGGDLVLVHIHFTQKKTRYLFYEIGIFLNNARLVVLGIEVVLTLYCISNMPATFIPGFSTIFLGDRRVQKQQPPPPLRVKIFQVP